MTHPSDIVSNDALMLRSGSCVASLRWRSLTRQNLPQRIDEARSAVLDRVEDRFSTKSSDGEQFELRNALEALSVLRKFAQSEIGLLCRA